MSDQIKFLFKYFFRYKVGYLIGFAAITVTNFLALLKPKVLGNAVDLLAKKNFAHTLNWYVAIFFILLISENLFRILWRKHLMSSSRRVERDMINDFFDHILKLDPSFYDKNSTGDLMARATNDVASIRMMLGPGIMSIIDATVIFSISLYFLIALSPKLTFYALIPTPIIIIIVGYILKNIHDNFDKVQEQYSTISTKAQENFSGINVIKSYNREQHEINAFYDVTSDYVKKFMKLMSFEAGLDPVINILIGIEIFIVLLVGGLAAISQKLTPGEFVQFIYYLNSLQWPVFALAWAANLYERGMASLDRIKRIIDEEPTINKTETYIKHDMNHETFTDNGAFQSGDIVFENVSFEYNSENPNILSEINLNIKQGTTLGVVGPMGSGKTTLLNMIARLYDPIKGKVLIGGKDIKDMPILDLRQHISFVTQEPLLFSRNIKDNLNLGRTHDPLDHNQLEESLELADVLEEVRDFHFGFETKLGERGVRLSGGQKQRMTIARALARKTEILMLDDTLSSVDTHTEGRIINNLKKFIKKRTNIIVSHRISSVKEADNIIVLMDGKIKEQGTHSELLAKEGFYYKLYQQQILKENIEGM